MRLFYLINLLAIVFLASCTGQKNIPNNYLYHLKDSSDVMLVNMPEPRIQKNDLLHIRVFSMSLVPETDIPYNLPDQGAASNALSPTSGFLVDNDGFIEYPQIGKIKAEGLTREEVATIIKNKLSSSLINPSVIVRFLNFRVTVLGEVRTPGNFSAPTERITILEAIGMAGDITEYGNRALVKVAREKDGIMEIGQVDLTSKNIFSSPYFRLKQNDVVFVEQTGLRERQRDQAETIQRISIATGVITTIVVIINILIRR